jgi:hypothetical protein
MIIKIQGIGLNHAGLNKLPYGIDVTRAPFPLFLMFFRSTSAIIVYIVITKNEIENKKIESELVESSFLVFYLCSFSLLSTSDRLSAFIIRILVQS